MSICSRYLECLNTPLTFLMMMKLTVVKDASGNHFINLCYDECDDCDDRDYAVDCVSDMTVEQLAGLILGEDECGLPAWNVTGNICAACE